MPDLHVGVVVDASSLGQLASASKSVGDSIEQMAAKFSRAGMSSNEVASALTGLGFSAKEVAASLNTAGTASAATETKFDSLSRAMALASSRIAGIEIGAGALGGSLGRVAAASQVLAPAMVAAFPVFVAIALSEQIERAYEGLRNLEFEGLRNAEAWQKIDHESTSSLANLDEAIDRADVKIAELTQGKLAGLRTALSLVGDGAVEMASKINSLFDNIGTQLEKEKTFFESVKEFSDAVGSFGVMLPDQGEIAKAFGSDLAKTLDTQGLAAGIEKTSNQIRVVNQELAKTPGDKQLEQYAQQLIRVLGLLEARQTLEDKSKAVASAELAKASIDQANEAQERFSDVIADGSRLAKEDLASFEKLQRGKAEAAAQAAREVTEVLAAEARANAEGVKSITHESAESYVSQWREAIRSQSEQFRASQKDNELGMGNVRANTSLSAAGTGAGAFRDVIEGHGIEQAMAVASSAMKEAKAQAASYNLELAAIARAQSQLDTSTTSGASAFKEMQNEIDLLRRQYDSANAEAQKWGNTIITLQTQQRTLFQNFGAMAQNSAQAGFDAFNSGFIKMITGGETAARMFQTVWSSLAENFIVSVLKMAEHWVAAEALKLVATKAANTASTEDTLAQNAVKRLDSAKTAAASAMASTPFPLDLIVGPVVFAAALAFEKGGLIPGLSGAATPIIGHAGEMVLPAHLSSFVQNAAARASGGTSTGMPGTSPSKPIHFHYSPTVSAMDGKGVESVLAAHGDKFFANIKSRLRKMGINN